MPIEDLMWVEKYRPARLDDVAGQESIRKRLEALLQKKEQLPHLLFAGPPGSGKTTTALLVAKEILGDQWRDYTLVLNASDERGIDVVRERIKTFARYADKREGVPFRLVILDESDEMCLNPDTKILVGTLDDLREASLRELLESKGRKRFRLPSFGEKGLRLEDDWGRIVPSGRAELYKVTFDDGRTVEASSEHPFFQVQGRVVKTIRTKELSKGSTVAEFSDRILRCYGCSTPFYRANPWEGYEHHFCSTSCRNEYFGTLSTQRPPEERTRIRALAARGMKEKGVYESPDYRRKRSETAHRLIREGRIPDPRTWKKFAKGQGAWMGKKLPLEHRKSISDGDRRYFAEHPEVKEEISRHVRTALLDPTGPYQRLVRSGFFKEASKRASAASLASWSKKGFRSKTEEKMAALLDSWGLEYARERVILPAPSGEKYPLAVDFMVGNVAIFVNGCWWHVCNRCGVEPRYEKQKRNMVKDERHYRELERLGYRVVVVWEHELNDPLIVSKDVVPRIFHMVGVSGGHPPKVRHARVASIEKIGMSDVLNVNVDGNRNFILANGVLTHNTSDGQTALRRIMEENSKHTRFILVCNYSSGIIEPLQSRCAIFRFQRLDEASVTQHLEEIAKKEKLKHSGDAVFGEIYDATQGDLRQAINLLQAASATGEVTIDAVKSVSGAAAKARVFEIVKAALEGDFEAARTKMIELTRVYGIPERDFLKYANESLGSLKVPDMAKAISILAEYDFRLVQGAQPELQLTAMLAQLSSLKGGRD
ncbi:MAG: AAA family ATPase [Nitrososphaerota archaeon]|nr:AAA family ATPase [Nitrososphaerota archaeon]